MAFSSAVAPPPRIFALSAASPGGDLFVASVTIPLWALAAVMLTVFLLGGCAGFALGIRRGRKHGAHDVLGKGTARRRDDQSCEKEPDDDDHDDNDLAVLGDVDEVEGEEEDGPTTVLRGSLDLMASRWGIANDAGTSTTRSRSSRRGEDGARGRNGGGGGGDGDSAAPSPSSSAPSSHAVVEYLSPEKMTEMLFSRVNRDGTNVSKTLRLDEYGEKSMISREIPSPKSSTTDIVDLPSPSKLKNNNNDKTDKESDSDVEAICPADFVHLLSLIQKYSVDTSHPYFFNQLFGSLDPIALAAEIVALSVNTSVYTYETAPVFTLLEREVMGQIGKLVFRDENDDGEKEFEGEGLMIPGGSLANLTAMHAARHRWKVMNGYTSNHQSELDEESRRIVTEEDGAELQRHYWPEDGEEEKKLEDVSSHGALSPSLHDSERHITSSQQRSDTVYDDDRPTPDLVAFVSSEAHYSFSKSARVLGLREDDLIVVPTHPDGRMDVKELAKRIEELEFELEVRNGGVGRSDQMTATGAERARHFGSRRKRVPFFVACTAGSTVRGSFDDVADIVKVCRDYESRGHSDDAGAYERSIWVHVDGAWGGSAIFSSRPSIRRVTHSDDIRLADSFTFNPHKMLGAPQQTTAFIVRHRRALRDANAAGAKYLFDPRKNGAEYDLGDLSYTCGRRTDAVKLWALWKYYGREGLGRRVDQKADELEAFVEEVKRRGREDGSFALACRPWLFNVNFFYFPPRIRRALEARGVSTTCGNNEGGEGGAEKDDFVRIPDDIAQDLANVSVRLKLRLHEAGEMIIPYQPLNNQKADCFRLVLAGRKDFGVDDVRHVLDTMERYGADL